MPLTDVNSLLSDDRTGRIYSARGFSTGRKLRNDIATNADIRDIVNEHFIFIVHL